MNKLLTYIVLFTILNSCISQKMIVQMECNTHSYEDGVYNFLIKNNSTDTVYLMSNINSGLNPQIFEEDKQITNFVIYNMIDGDKTYFYPIFDYFNPQVKFDKILPNDFFNLELKLGAFYNWNIFKDTNTRDDLMLELLVYYMKKGELLSLKIEIPLI